MRERWWSAAVQYPGYAPAYLGSVRATGAETARVALEALWREISPHPPSPIISPLPGRLVMADDDA